MKTIKEKAEILYEIKNSKFYTFLYPIDSEIMVERVLNDLKKKYKDATHYCYAYIIDGKQKCSDDKEPNGTAGIPILNGLKQRELNHILCVVIRYFGGIKLGAGGLVRAYSKATSMALEKANIKEVELGFKLRIEFSYENIKQINYILKDYLISYKEYDENVIYEFTVKKKDYENLKKELHSYLIKEEVLEEVLY